MTRAALGDAMIEVVPALRRFVPPAAVVDKFVYSPWLTPALEQQLREWETSTVVVTGGETDVCVLATVLGAIDRGFRVVVAEDAICSSSDETHDALVTLYGRRFSQQLTMMSTDDLLREWPSDRVRATVRSVTAPMKV